MSNPPTIPEVRLAAMLTDSELFEELIEAHRVKNPHDGDLYLAVLKLEAGRRWFHDRKLTERAA